MKNILESLSCAVPPWERKSEWRQLEQQQQESVNILEQITQQMIPLGYVPFLNSATNTGINTVAGIDMLEMIRVITIVPTSVFNTSANIQVYYQASATSNMASPTNVAAAVPLTSNTSNRINTLEVRADQLPVGTRYLQPIVVVNTSTVNLSIQVWGFSGSYKPGNTAFAAASLVDQQKVT